MNACVLGNIRMLLDTLYQVSYSFILIQKQYHDSIEARKSELVKVQIIWAHIFWEEGEFAEERVQYPQRDTEKV